ncbi:MAG: DUF5667 domain-containing protein [Chloroflexota bacterium]
MDDFKDILNSCLDWLRQGKSVEECLAAYPDQAEELRDLLYTALKAREAFSAVELRPEVKAQAQYRLLSQPRPVYRPWWFRRWAVAVMPVLAVLLLGSSTVLAANNSLPGDSLYGVKLAVEQLRAKLPRSGVEKAQYQLKLAEKRIDEMASLSSAREQKSQAVDQTGQQMIEHLKKIKQSMGTMKRADAAKLRSRIIQQAPQHRQQLRRLKQVQSAPSSAPPALKALERAGDRDWEVEYEKFLDTLLQE